MPCECNMNKQEWATQRYKTNEKKTGGWDGSGGAEGVVVHMVWLGMVHE